MKSLGRIILALLFCWVGAGLGNAQVRKNDLEHEGFKGRIKTVKTESARMVKDSGHVIEKARQVINIDSYNVEGQLVKRSAHFPGQPVAEILFTYGKDGSRESSQETSGRDSFRNYAADRAAENSLLGSKCNFSFDSRGNRTEESCRVNLKRVVFLHRFEYDAHDRLTSDLFSRNSGFVFRKTYSYDDKGNVTAMSQYDAKGRLINREYYSYEFDSTGNWIRRKMSKLHGSEGNLTYEPFEVNYRTISYY